MNINLKNIIREKKCKKCGKTFIVAPMHVYKSGKSYYCSWTCYLHRKDPITKSNIKLKGNQKND